MKELLAALLAAVPGSAQSLVFDRPLTGKPHPQRIERPGKGAFAEAFRIGSTGEVWMMDALRVWAMPATGAACGKELGDSIEKITILGALDNPPVPGQPVCDCHALVPIATIPLKAGSSASQIPSATLTQEDGVWRIDVREARWSVPGGTDVLFTVRVTPRGNESCHADTRWSLAASPAPDDYRLHLLNEKGVPVGLADPAPRFINIQVWGRPNR